MVTKMDNESAEIESLLAPETPEATVAMLKVVAEEHPDAVAIVVSLLNNGWTMTPTGEQRICVTLRSASGHVEVLGYGPTVLDAFEEIERKTRNFTKLLSGLEV